MFRDRAGSASRLALAAAAFALAAAPGSVLAVGLIDKDAPFGNRGAFASFTPASADPALAKIIARRSGGKAPLMRFTPASAVEQAASRSVTVAVRIDQQVARSIASRAASDSAREGEAPGQGLRIAPTRYNLGLALGYRSFAAAPSLATAPIPDLAEFRPSPGVRKEPSRFAARVNLAEERLASQAAEAVERPGDLLLDVGGSYRLTENLDVRAGVRYQQERDLLPLPDLRQRDSQAIFIGTQFRF